MARPTPNQPFMPTATGDWLKDPKLRRCSAEARGVLMDIRCLLWEASPRGVFGSSASPWSMNEILDALPGNQDVNRRCVAELLTKGPLAKSGRTGRVFSPEMVRDELKRRRQTRGGKKGMARRYGKNLSPPVTTPVSQPVTSSENEIEIEIGSSVRIPGESEGAARAGPSSADYPIVRMFDTFRTKYPRARVGGVVAARAAFVQAAHVGAGFWRCSPLDASERLCVLAEEYAASPRVKGRALAHVPYAANWLEKGEWQDPEQWLIDETAPKPERSARDYAKGAR